MNGFLLGSNLCAKGRMLWTARNCGDDLHLFVAIVNHSVIETRRQVKCARAAKLRVWEPAAFDSFLTDAETPELAFVISWQDALIHWDGIAMAAGAGAFKAVLACLIGEFARS
jgi:hypothetical protein